MRSFLRAPGRRTAQGALESQNYGILHAWCLRRSRGTGSTGSLWRTGSRRSSRHWRHTGHPRNPRARFELRVAHLALGCICRILISAFRASNPRRCRCWSETHVNLLIHSSSNELVCFVELIVETEGSEAILPSLSTSSKLPRESPPIVFSSESPAETPGGATWGTSIPDTVVLKTRPHFPQNEQNAPTPQPPAMQTTLLMQRLQRTLSIF